MTDWYQVGNRMFRQGYDCRTREKIEETFVIEKVVIPEADLQEFDTSHSPPYFHPLHHMPPTKRKSMKNQETTEGTITKANLG
jgi:hypothetical protein